MTTHLFRRTGSLLALAFFVTACNTVDPEFNAPVTPERINFVADRQYPEGITYSPTLDKFLVSSLTQGKVGIVDQNGRYTDLFSDAQLIGAVGMKVRNNLLYICNGDQGVSTKSTAQTTMKTAGLFVYNLGNGQYSQVRLDTLLPGTSHYPNDIAFDKAGNAYVTDSFAKGIYIVTPDLKARQFTTNTLFSGATGINLNGIVYHPDGYLIVVKSNDGKLFKISLTSPATVTEVKNVNLPNGDGMVLYNNDLYVVNGRNKVSQLRSSDGWLTAAVVKTDSVGYGQSTTNVEVGGKIYTLNARIDEVTAAAQAKNPGLLTASQYSIQQFK